VGKKVVRKGGKGQEEEKRGGFVVFDGQKKKKKGSTKRMKWVETNLQNVKRKSTNDDKLTG